MCGPISEGYHTYLEFFGYLSPVLAYVARFPRATRSYSLFPVVLSPVVAFVARFPRATIYLPQQHLVVTRPVPTPAFQWPLLPYFFPTPQLLSLAQFPRAGTHGVFDTRYMIGSPLTYRPRLGPRRAELWCFLKNVFFLNLILVFVYSFRFVYSFNFCIICIVKMQESSRQGSLLPPSRWFQWGGGRSTSLSYTSLDLPPSTTCTGPHVAEGWERVGGIPGSHSTGFPPTPSSGFPLSCIYFSLVYSYISRLGFSSGFFSRNN